LVKLYQEANHLSSISVAMNEVIKLLMQLVKVYGDPNATSSVAQGSAAKYKADLDEELLNQLKNRKFIKLYQELLSWEPHPELGELSCTPCAFSAALNQSRVRKK